MKRLALAVSLLVAVSASADKNDATQYWSGFVISADGGDVDYCLTSTALANGDQDHSGSITANCDARGELVTNTLGSILTSVTVAPSHGIRASAVARGIIIQVDDDSGAGLSVDATITGWTASGSTRSETIRGLTDSTGTGLYTVYFFPGHFTGLSAIETTTTGQGASDDITVGYGAALVTPTYKYSGAIRLEAVSGTNATVININGLPAFTQGGANAGNYTDQIVLEPTGSPTAASREVGTHNMKNDGISVILDVVGAANAGETVYVESTMYDK